MRWLGILSLGTMLAVGVGVGWRLLSLTRRTGGAPEACMGLGLLLVTVVGGPLSAVGRLPQLLGTTAGDFLFALGLAATLAGIACFYAFTWRVFRPGSRAARGVLWAACLALAVQWVGLLSASSRGASLDEIVPHTRPWALAIVLTLALGFLWTAVESLTYHALLRRRLALGLADPVVTNRFLLWGLSGLATVALSATVAASLLAGHAPLRDTPPLVCIALAGVVSAGTWYLAFLPPAPYLRFLRRREPARS
jgi:hypothetical protein